jgi:CRISPR-associated protein Cmr3
MGMDAEGHFDVSQREALMGVAVHGPLLARTKAKGWELLAPAPQDALWEGVDGKRRLHHLHPIAHALRGGSAPDGMDLVGMEAPPEGKPPKDIPAYWTWNHLVDWLKAPGQVDVKAIHDQGEIALRQEERLSVAIDPETGTYRHGALFGVESLVLRTSQNRLEGVRELALALRTDANLQPGMGYPHLEPGIGYLGGKNKLATFRMAEAPPWPESCPFLEALSRSERLRVVLLTPGIFHEGWRPSWLLEPRHGLAPKLRAARVDRPETLSGWDYATGQTKPTRRAASAGSVYWLELGGTEVQRRTWIEDHWLKPVSDDDQDRQDGFGLAVMGVWA